MMALPLQNNYEQFYDFKKDEELLDNLAMCVKNTKLFCKTFFPETFDLPFSTLHDKIFDLLDNSDCNYKVIAAPRGIGKTSVARAVCARNILFRLSHFIPYVSKSETMAMMQSENIKNELRYNQVIRKLFGDIKTSDYVDDDPQFSKHSWITFQTIVMPRGNMQQLRGLNWLGFRPDNPVFDDLEDDEEVENDDLRLKLRRLFFSSHIKCVPQHHRKWQIVYIDTIKHEDALITHLLNAPEWESLELSICDDNYKTLAPDFKPQIVLDQEVEEHRNKKMMDIFAREYMAKPISREDAAFQQDMFHYYKETDKEFVERVNGGRIETVVIVDPAKTAKMHNAESGIAVWGVDTESNALYLRECRGEHHHPDELIADALDTCVRYHARVLGFEKTGLGEFGTFPVLNEISRRGMVIEPVFLEARSGKGEFSGLGGGKKGRVAAMIGFYRQGLVFHNEANCAPYELQLLSFPRPKRWDMIDAAAYIIEMLEKGLRYFEPKEVYEEVSEDEYADLMNEPAEDDWRLV
jgi:hypothetical protein